MGLNFENLQRIAAKKLDLFFESKKRRVILGMILIVCPGSIWVYYVRHSSPVEKSITSTLIVFFAFAINITALCYLSLSFFKDIILRRSVDRRAMLMSASIGFSVGMMSVLWLMLMLLDYYKLITFSFEKPETALIYFLGAFGAIVWESSKRAIANDEQRRKLIKDLQNEVWKNPDNLHLKAFLVNEAIAQGLHFDFEFRDYIKGLIKYLSLEPNHREEFQIYSYLKKEIEMLCKKNQTATLST